MASLIETVKKSVKVRQQLSELSGVALGKPDMAAQRGLLGQVAFETWLLSVLQGIYARLDSAETAKPKTSKK